MVGGKWARARRRVRSTWSSVHPWVVVVLLFGSFLAAYLSTLTRRYTFDSVAYATQIRSFGETGNIGWLFHPHHLAFNAVGLFSWRLLQGVGMDADPLLALQYTNAFAGALGLVVFYEMLRRGGFRLSSGHSERKGVWPPLALAATLLLGGAFGYWTCATDGRANMPSILALTAFLGLAWGTLSAPTALQVSALAAVTVAVIALHQSSGLLIPAALASVVLSRGWGRKKLRLVLLYLVLTAVGVTTLYAGVGFLVKGAESMEDVKNWALTYARDGRWWSFDIRRNLILDMQALAHVFAPTVGAMASGEMRRLGFIASLLVFAALLAEILPRLTRARSADNGGHAHRYAAARTKKLATLAVVILAYVAFFTVWTPGYFAFWLPVGLALAAGLALFFAGRGRAIEVSATALLLLTAGVVGRLTLVEAVLPAMRAESNDDLIFSRSLLKHVGREDLVLMAGVGDPALPDYAEVYIPYFTRASLRLLSNDLARAKGDVDAVVRATRGIIRDRLRNGDRVIVLPDYESAASRVRLAGRYKGAESAPTLIVRGYRLEALRDRGSVVAYRLSPSECCTEVETVASAN